MSEESQYGTAERAQQAIYLTGLALLCDPDEKRQLVCRWP